MSQCPISRLSFIHCSVFKVRFQTVKVWVQHSFLWILNSNLKDRNFAFWRGAARQSTKTWFCLERGASRSAYKGTRKAKQRSIKQKLVGLSGLEPPTSRLSGGRSNRLSYKPMLVEIIGIEPMTPCLQSRCSPSWAIPPGFAWVLNEPQKLNNDFKRT